MNKYDDVISRLNPLEYKVTQQKGTEPPFNNVYDQEFREGIYIDKISKQVLFSSLDKFDSGCGWPAFFQPITKAAVKTKLDFSHGMIRTEVRSEAADSHLGHVFNDAPGGRLRYCINSASLIFIPKSEMAKKGYEDYLYLFKKEE